MTGHLSTTVRGSLLVLACAVAVLAAFATVDDWRKNQVDRTHEVCAAIHRLALANEDILTRIRSALGETAYFRHHPTELAGLDSRIDSFKSEIVAADCGVTSVGAPTA